MEEKNPLQEEKEKRIDEILNKEHEEPKEKPKRRRRRKKADHEPEPEPTPSPEELEMEAMFLLEMANQIRGMIGVTDPIPEPLAMTWKESFKMVAVKYHAVVSKWMPEIAFFGSTAAIVVDTMKRLEAVKDKEIQKAKEKAQGKANPLQEESLIRDEL